MTIREDVKELIDGERIFSSLMSHDGFSAWSISKRLGQLGVTSLVFFLGATRKKRRKRVCREKWFSGSHLIMCDCKRWNCWMSMFFRSTSRTFFSWNVDRFFFGWFVLQHGWGSGYGTPSFSSFVQIHVVFFPNGTRRQ